LISIRSGDFFHIEAVKQNPPSLAGADLSIRDNESCQNGCQPRRDDLKRSLIDIELFRPSRIFTRKILDGVPIIIGQRVIGHLEIASSHEDMYDLQDLQRLSFQAERLAYVVENAIVFAEAARYFKAVSLTE